MNTPQENKLTMYVVVRDFLAANSTLTATLPAFAAGVTRFNTELTQLQSIALGSDAETKGLTADKAAKKETMARLTGDIASLLRAYALVEGDKVLEVAAATTYSDVIRARDTEAPDLAERIQQQAAASVGALADYGITVAETTALGTAIAAFRAVVTAPRAVIASGAVSTQDLETAFAKVDAELTILDRLNAFFRTANNSFFVGYESSRVIVDAAASHPGQPVPPAVPI
jgi:hypothetical protein